MAIDSTWLQIGIPSILSAAVAFAIARWSARASKRASEELARAQGKLKASDISMNVLGKKIDPLDPRLNFDFGHPGESGVALFPITFNVKNSGERAAEGLVLLIQAGKVFLAEPEMIKNQVTQEVLADGLAHSATDLGNFRQWAFRLPMLYPQMRFVVSQPLILTPTLGISRSVEMEMQDAPGKVKYEFSFRVDLAVTLLIPDQPPVRIDCTFGARSADSLEDLAKKTAKHLSHEVKARASKVHGLRRLKFFFGRRAYLYKTIYWFPKYESGPGTQGMVYEIDPFSPPKVAKTRVACPRFLLTDSELAQGVKEGRT